MENIMIQFFELLGLFYFLLIGVAGCLYPFLIQENNHTKFHKTDDLYTDGDNT